MIKEEGEKSFAWKVHSRKRQEWPILMVKHDFPETSPKREDFTLEERFTVRLQVTECVSSRFNIWIWFQIDEVKTLAFKGKNISFKET